MKDLKQQLEALRDRMADEYYQGSTSHDAHESYQAGFNAAIPIILEMAKSLKYYSKEDFDRVCFLDHATCEENYGAYARDVLNKLKQFVDLQMTKSLDEGKI